MRRRGRSGIVERDLERGLGDNFGGVLAFCEGGMIDCILGDLGIENLGSNCIGWAMF